MNNESFQRGGDSIRSFLRILRQHWLPLLLCLIIVPAAAFGYDRLQPRKYQATTNLLLTDGSGPAVSTAASSADQSTLMSTELNIAGLPAIANLTGQSLGYPYGAMPGSVAVNNDGSSNIITVTATESNPVLAARVANAYANEYIKFSTASSSSLLRRQEADLRRRITQLGTHSVNASLVAALRAQLAGLTTVAAVQNTSLQLVAPATPPGSPSSPKTARIVGAGAVLGLLLGILLAILFAMLDRRLRRPGDVEAALEGPILGAVPRSRALAKAWGSDGDGPSGLDLESFSMIYANMSSLNEDEPLRSVLITSANGGEGKSTVAWNLALTGARTGARVLLIEADMRRPTIAARIGAEVEGGLVDVLSRRRVSPSDVIKAVPLSARPGSLLAPSSFSADTLDGGEEPVTAIGPPANGGRSAGWNGEGAGQHPAFNGESANQPATWGAQPSAPAHDAPQSVYERYRRRLKELDPRVPHHANGVYEQSRTAMQSPGYANGAPPAPRPPETPQANLEVLFAGERSGALGRLRSPAALLASGQMRELLRAAETAYDLVVIDSPPTAAVSDAVPLIRQVSGVLVVSRVSKTTYDSAAALRAQLANLKARTVGVVVNGIDSGDDYYASASAYLEHMPKPSRRSKG